MYPILFRIGDFPITGKMLARYGLDPRLIWDLLAWTAVAGIIGAKIYFLALHWPELVASPRELLFAREGLVWYGGLIGGVLAYYVQVRSRKLPPAVMFDATAPALMLGIALGRIGCFLVGDDYGVHTDGPLGIAFPQGMPPSTAGYLRSVGDAIPATIPDSAVVAVHPTQP
jgi:phosphatidylglycerol:prolipoprotein diacylglycerol transferase